MPLCLPKCQAEDFQVGGEMSARQGSAGCVCWAPKSLCWRLMSFPVSGLLAERSAEAQMTSLETSLSLGEITNGTQPLSSCCLRKSQFIPWPHSEKCLERRHLGPQQTLLLSALWKRNSGASELFSKLPVTVIIVTGQPWGSSAYCWSSTLCPFSLLFLESAIVTKAWYSSKDWVSPWHIPH